MSDGSSFPQPVVSATEPRRWIAAIVGGVLLGEALWSMLQLLIRDWAAPALANAMGQGPTQNPAAFEPLPLVVAFVEACVAAIVLVLLMSWAQRKTRVVVRTVTAPVAQAVAATSVVEAPRVAVPPTPAVVQAPRPMAPAPVAATAVPAPPVPVVSAPAALAQAVPIQTPPAAVPVTPQATPAKPPTPPAPKKPKTIYYNSVGEPIEE